MDSYCWEPPHTGMLDILFTVNHSLVPYTHVVFVVYQFSIGVFAIDLQAIAACTQFFGK